MDINTLINDISIDLFNKYKNVIYDEIIETAPDELKNNEAFCSTILSKVAMNIFCCNEIAFYLAGYTNPLEHLDAIKAYLESTLKSFMQEARERAH